MIERQEVPTEDSCWATCISMLTDIDLGLLHLGMEVAPGYDISGPIENWTLSMDEILAWKKMLKSVGYRLSIHSKAPDGIPYILGFLYLSEQGEWGGHVVVVDDFGHIIDPSPGGVMNGMKPEQLDEFCNIVIPKRAYYTVTVS
jgi:hypothetical protein